MVSKRKVARGEVQYIVNPRTTLDNPIPVVWCAVDNDGLVRASGTAPTAQYAITDANKALIRADCVPF